MKKEYKEVVDFWKNTTPQQHVFFLELISNRLTFFNIENKEMYDIEEEHMIDFNGVFIQIPIK
jgi:hypothetical protein